MKIFVTGASGWIGSAVVNQLVGSGHEVLGLARSDERAADVKALGAEVVRGDIEDVGSLRAAAESSDGVIHLAYNHDFSDMAGAARTDRAVIESFADILAGSDRPLVMASGVIGAIDGRPGTENDRPESADHPRIANANATVALAERGVRSVVVRFAPTVHGEGDQGFISWLVGTAREKGVSGYPGDGSSRWPAVHRLDAADLVCRSVDKAKAGSIVHATAEGGVTAKAIAEAIGRGLDLPVESIAPDQAADHFGFLAFIFGRDLPMSNDITRRTLDWNPTGPTLIEDIDAGHYFR